MDLRSRHKKRVRISSKRSRKKSRLDRFLTSSLFKAFGFVFLLIGIYYSFSTFDGASSPSQILMNFFNPAKNVSYNVGNGIGSVTLLLFYFLPLVSILAFTALFEKRFSAVTAPLSLITAIYLIVIQTKIILYDNVIGNGVYSSLFMADCFLFLTILLLLINVVLNKKPLLLILTCIYFYLSIILFTRFGWVLAYLFPFVILFSIAIGYAAQKIKKPYINLLNFIFAIGFFCIFWIRRMLIRDSPELLTEFFIYGALFYIVFYGILIYAAMTKEQPMSQWMQGVMGWINLLFYAGTTSFVMIHYYSFNHLWTMMMGLILFNLLGLYLLQKNHFSNWIRLNTDETPNAYILPDKYHSTVWLVPHHFAVMLLSALVLPLLFQHNMVLLFIAGLSIFILIYANVFKNKAAALISFCAIISLMADYLYNWITSYLPAFILEVKLPDNVLLWRGIVDGIIVVVALRITIGLLKDTELPLTKKWFRRNTYNRLIRGLLLFSLFLALGWIGFALIISLTRTMNYTSLSWFITGSLFFIGLINYYSGKHSTFKKPSIYLGFTLVLLYPLLVQWSMNITLDNLIQDGTINSVAWLLHYLALGLAIVLGVMTIWRIYRLNSKTLSMQRGVQVLTIFLLLFLLCTEYDNLSVLILSMQNSSNNGPGIGAGALDLNQHLPYSIIMWALAVLIFIYSIFYHNRFLRGFAIVLYIIVLVKLFAYDFETLGTAARSNLFFIVGLFLIGFSFLYPRLLKAESKLQEERHRISKPAQQVPEAIDYQPDPSTQGTENVTTGYVFFLKNHEYLEQ